MATTYTVVKGDNLTKIAAAYGTTVSNLVALNNIKNPDYIVVGQVLTISADSSGGSDGGSAGGSSGGGSVSYSSSRASIYIFGLQANTDRTVYAAWNWSLAYTENYQVIWYYDTGNAIWFIGSDSTVNDTQSIYSAPSNAKRVKCKVKPISKKYRVNDTEVSYWTAEWSTEHFYDFSSNPPTVPSVPNVTIDKYTLTAELDNLNVNGTAIIFHVIKNNSTVFKTGSATIDTGHASFSCTIDAGAEYKVRCRSYRDGIHSDWSEYSNNISAIPSAPSKITKCVAKSETSIYLEWDEVKTAETYEIEYTTKKEYFDGSDQTTSISNIEFTHYEKTGLESGEEYFFRVRASSNAGTSGWSEIKSIVIGKDPAAPTTWSSTTTVVVGEPLNLYWMHNTEDGSSQVNAELELIIDGVTTVETVKNSTDEDEKDKTSVYSVDTKKYSEGTTILWRVRTSGITNVYGDWSIQRTVDVYAPPSLELSVTNSNGEIVERLESFPLHVTAKTGPNTQFPIGYHIIVSANDTYEKIDQIGNTSTISKGSQIYSKQFNMSDELSIDISAGDIDLENNINYTLTCVVAMNSGLTAESSVDFTVAWADELYCMNAEIGIDKDNVSASIRPYCVVYEPVYHKVSDFYGTYTVLDETIEPMQGTWIENAYTITGERVLRGTGENGEEIIFCIVEFEKEVLVEGITFSVYRREFDGSFVEIATGIKNTSRTFVTDPHPSLDYARYRIVAITDSTGAVSYYDVPAYPVKEIGVVIQWNEQWTSFNADGEDSMEQPPWSGSLLKLPYNIDVSDKYQSDVSLVNYIGRKRPVSYYGTHLGETSTWSMDIDKKDKETLYALRRLAIWMGDVYVREPSGSGYWAKVSVSFSQTHCEVTIPVTLDITRVEGGI